MTISNFMTVIGLVNGMIGGVILVLPLLALKTGWVLILPITLFSGFVSYFTCLLCLRHLRNYKNLDAAIYHHFGKRMSYKISYDVIIIVSMTTLLVLYFSLICEQWAGLLGESKIIPILNALVLFPIVYVMKKYDFGATLLAYGILSIIGYVLFLTWLALTTEKGPKQIPAVQSQFVDFAAALASGFSIQTFFIPILRKNPNQKKYKSILGFTYVIGTIIYGFIAYGGAFSIVNRTTPFIEPETIEDYFGSGANWQVDVLEIIYLIHLYSAFPEFLLISKQRFFSIFKWPEPRDVSIKEVIYVAVTIFLSLLVKLTSMKVTIIIVLNGSIISFFFIYVVPIGLHIKCVYFTNTQERHQMLNEEREKEQENVQPQKNQSDTVQSADDKNKEPGQMQQVQYELQNQPKITSKNEPITISDQASARQQPINQVQAYPAGINENQSKIESVLVSSQSSCQCDIKFRSKYHQYAELAFLGIMIIFGLLIMGYSLYLMLTEEKESTET